MIVARLKFIDFDARRDPRTDHWCIRCQKDIAPDQPHATVRCLVIDGAPYALHPDDEAAYDRGETAAFTTSIDAQDVPMKIESDLGHVPMGLDCVRRHGREWTFNPIRDKGR